MKNKGFTLVEVAIVIVIIGLIIGGVLAGRSLVKGAELKSIIAQSQQFQTAITEFKNKYDSLPGDMSDATKFWGIAAGNGSNDTCRAFESTGTETCNGNDNGRVDTSSERFRFWQHLANARLIDGTFTGVSSNGVWGTGTVAGRNAPAGDTAGTVWYIEFDAANGDLMYDVARNRHNFRLGGVRNNQWPYASKFTPAELWSIDQKNDDGAPAFGDINGTKSTFWAAQNCTTSGGDDAEYNLTFEKKACIIVISAGF